MIIEFSAPASELTPFLIAPSAPHAAVPVPGAVTASMLNIRLAPSTSSVIVGGYPNGTAINVLC